ncbi:hypothetical protein ACH45F_00930 [Catenuloplanes sp. NPDC020197]|uniref:Uncharacterized protein n=2 Tax=Catenuloplanes niger TaxID=587534 RepID=A0AAE3ZJT3_9ACTN|nr:hypothetical protein [Catenuloplanes niger]
MLEHNGWEPAHYPDEYPTAQELTDEGSGCSSTLYRQVFDTMTLPVNAEIRWYVPTERQWADGQRGIYCWFASDGDLPTRTVDVVPSVVTEDQQRFLFVVEKARLAAARAFDERVSFRPRRQAAREVAASYLSRTTPIVRNGFDTVRPQVEAMAAEDARLAETWTPATTAATEAEFEAALAAIGGWAPTAGELALREAIGLPTAQGELFGR